MSKPSVNLSIYLNNTYNLNILSDRLSKSFNSIFNDVRYGKSIGYNFKNYLNDFPKYPINFKYINNLDNFNLLLIKNCVSDSVKYLLDRIDDNVIDYKTTLDKIPNSNYELFIDVDLQNTYFTNIEDFFNQSTDLLNYLNIKEYSNWVFKTIGTPHSNNSDNVDAINQLILFIITISLFNRITNFENQFIDYIINSNKINRDLLNSSFQKFITDNEENISSEMGEIILKNIYLVIQTTDMFITNNVKQVIKDNLNNLTLSFINFINDNKIDLALETSKLIVNLLNHCHSLDIVKYACDNNNIIIPMDNVGFDIIETKLLDEKIDLIDEFNIQSYLNLCYLYKFWPIKFVNVIPLVSKKLTEEILITPSDNLVDSNDIKFYLSKFNKYGIDYDSYVNLLTESFDKINLSKINTKYNIIDFVIKYYTVIYLDKFLDSIYFSNHLEDLLRKIFDEMVKKGNIKHTHNWYQCLDLIKLYFKSLFRTSVFNKENVSELFNVANFEFDNFINNNFNIIKNEIVQGSNTYGNCYFTTLYQFKEETIEVFLDDILLTNDDYIVSGKDHLITFKVPPLSSNIKVNYEISYEIINNINLNDITSFIKNYCEKTGTIDSIQKFLNNIYLSTINKEVLMNIINYFVKK